MRKTTRALALMGAILATLFMTGCSNPFDDKPAKVIVVMKPYPVEVCDSKLMPTKAKVKVKTE